MEQLVQCRAQGLTAHEGHRIRNCDFETHLSPHVTLPRPSASPLGPVNLLLYQLDHPCPSFPHSAFPLHPHRMIDQKRSSSLGSNRSHRSHTSGRLRSPSNDSAHRSGDDQGSRKRVLHSGSRDREKTKSLEITGERKSRIDRSHHGWL